jgi:RNA polymerase sigma-70 factor (ECF subfamily)
MSMSLSIQPPLIGQISRKGKFPLFRLGSTSEEKSVSTRPASKPKQMRKPKPMLENGELLWQRVGDGDSSAIGELYDQIGSALFALAFRILNDRWEAEEIVQDIFANFWKNPNAYSPTRGKLHSWLMTITRNRSIDRYRSRRRRKDDAEIDEVTLQTRPDPVAENAGESAEFSDDKVALKNALKAVGEKQRQVLELSFFKGLSHSEIAINTGLSVGTVKSRIRLGLDKLRGQLAGLR